MRHPTTHTHTHTHTHTYTLTLTHTHTHTHSLTHTHTHTHTQSHTHNHTDCISVDTYSHNGSRRAKPSRPKRPCSWTTSLVTASRLCTQSAVLRVDLDVAIDSTVSRSSSRAQTCKFTDTRSILLHPVRQDGGGVHHA
jgi:hypothetical protein